MSGFRKALDQSGYNQVEAYFHDVNQKLIQEQRKKAQQEGSEQKELAKVIPIGSRTSSSDTPARLSSYKKAA